MVFYLGEVGGCGEKAEIIRVGGGWKFKRQISNNRPGQYSNQMSNRHLIVRDNGLNRKMTCTEINYRFIYIIPAAALIRIIPQIPIVELMQIDMDQTNHPQKIEKTVLQANHPSLMMIHSIQITKKAEEEDKKDQGKGNQVTKEETRV